MKYLSLLLIFISFQLHAKIELEVNSNIPKDRQSPWNFFDDFEDGKLTGYEFSEHPTKFGISNKDLYKIIKDENNSYLEITAKEGANVDPNNMNGTERAELNTKIARTLNREIWYGFRMRVPENFIDIDDRVLFTQFKNQHDPMKGSPLLGIRIHPLWDVKLNKSGSHQLGYQISIGGQVSGNAATRGDWDKDFYQTDIRFFNEIDNLSVDDFYVFNTEIAKKVYSPYLKCALNVNNYFLQNLPYTKKITASMFDNYRSINECENPDLKERIIFETANLISNFFPEIWRVKTSNTKEEKMFRWKKGEWQTYKIGIFNSKTEDGFVKVYQNNNLVTQFDGPTYRWNGNYTGTHIRIGIYRDRIPGKPYPDQTLHFDDFIVASDKATLDKYLD